MRAMCGQFGVQVFAVALAAVYAFAVTYGILKLVNRFTPVRVSQEDELLGLDLALHGEEAYDLPPARLADHTAARGGGSASANSSPTRSRRRAHIQASAPASRDRGKRMLLHQSIRVAPLRARSGGRIPLCRSKTESPLNCAQPLEAEYLHLDEAAIRLVYPSRCNTTTGICRLVLR